MSEQIVTRNDCFVSTDGDTINILLPRAMTKPEALRCAAWIVALADGDGTFGSVLEAVKNT